MESIRTGLLSLGNELTCAFGAGLIFMHVSWDKSEAGMAAIDSPGRNPGSGAENTLPAPPSAQGALVGSIGRFFCAGA